MRRLSSVQDWRSRLWSKFYWAYQDWCSIIVIWSIQVWSSMVSERYLCWVVIFIMSSEFVGESIQCRLHHLLLRMLPLSTLSVMSLRCYSVFEFQSSSKLNSFCLGYCFTHYMNKHSFRLSGLPDTLTFERLLLHVSDWIVWSSNMSLIYTTIKHKHKLWNLTVEPLKSGSPCECKLIISDLNRWETKRPLVVPLSHSGDGNVTSFLLCCP